VKNSVYKKMRLQKINWQKKPFAEKAVCRKSRLQKKVACRKKSPAEKGRRPKAEFIRPFIIVFPAAFFAKSKVNEVII